MSEFISNGESGYAVRQKLNKLKADVDNLTEALSSLSRYYTKDEIDKAINSVKELGFKVISVSELPKVGKPNTIYLVPSPSPRKYNTKDEYMYIGNAWELIGSIRIDLEDFEVKTNKVNEIRDDDSKLEDHFPSVKAVIDLCSSYETSSRISDGFASLTLLPNDKNRNQHILTGSNINYYANNSMLGVTQLRHKKDMFAEIEFISQGKNIFIVDEDSYDQVPLSIDGKDYVSNIGDIVRIYVHVDSDDGRVMERITLGGKVVWYKN